MHEYDGPATVEEKLQTREDIILRLKLALAYFFVRRDENTWALSRQQAEQAAKNVLGDLYDEAIRAE